jgi:hypothetical protein
MQAIYSTCKPVAPLLGGLVFRDISVAAVQQINSTTRREISIGVRGMQQKKRKITEAQRNDETLDWQGFHGVQVRQTVVNRGVRSRSKTRQKTNQF